MESLVICLAAIAREVLSEGEREVLARYCLCDGAEADTVEAVFGKVDERAEIGSSP